MQWAHARQDSQFPSTSDANAAVKGAICKIVHVLIAFYFQCVNSFSQNIKNKTFLDVLWVAYEQCWVVTDYM